MLTTVKKSFVTFINIATTSSSITLFVGRIGLIIKAKSTAAACRLRITIKVAYELVIWKYAKQKKHVEKHNKL